MGIHKNRVRKSECARETRQIEAWEISEVGSNMGESVFGIEREREGAQRDSGSGAY